MSFASLCYRVGWEARGWVPGVPLLGVPGPVRSALVSLARDSGWTGGDPLCPAADSWPEGRCMRDPMGDAPLRHRLAAGVLERVFRDHPGSGQEIAGTPWVWDVAGHPFPIDAHRLLHLDSLDYLRKLARRKGLSHRPIPAPPWERWTHLAPLAFRPWSMFWLGRLGRAVEGGQPSLKVRISGDEPLPALALADSLALASAVNRLYACGWALPEVLLDAPDLSHASSEALDAFLVCCSPLDRPSRLPVHKADIVTGRPELAEEQGGWVPARDVLAEGGNLETEAGGRASGYCPSVGDRAALDHLFSRYFPHAGLREEQYATLRRLVQGESLLVLLPTGYGKSAIFQLAALVQPATALVIAPLKSLIADQLRGLHEAGIRMAGKVEANNVSLGSLREGRLRLAYVTPERLQMANFRAAVEHMAERHRFSLIALDEAHCLSEWGHDFRPAFQHVRAFRRRLLRDQVEELPLVALTATASRAVRGELLSALDIPHDGIVQSRSSDRPELSFSVHLADDGDERAAALANAVLPRAQEIAAGERAGGVLVFAPFADAHDPTTYRTSAPVVCEMLDRALDEAGLCRAVGLHTSKRPRSCPNCGSHRYFQTYGNSTCDSCRHCFPNVPAQRRIDPGWEAHVGQIQTAFVAGNLPVMVATKGFGMGVDKKDIRLVAHVVMSGSLEGYSQEVGRAGRDGQHAHAALVVVPPTQECLANHVREDVWRAMTAQDEIPLPCLQRNANGFPLMQCPFGLQELCDFGQQASLIQMNFPGLGVESRDSGLAYARARASVEVQPDDALNRDRLTKALTRLQQLGVIESFTEDRPVFRLERGTHEREAVIRRLEEALGSFLGRHRLIGEASRLRGRPPGEDIVPAAGRLLIEAVYVAARGNRLQSLMNLHRYATLGEGECRRAYLQQQFDVASLRRQGNCGFCDRCVPSLDFQRDRAIIAPAEARDQELSSLLMESVENIDLAGLAEVVSAGLSAGYANALRARADLILEDKAGQPVALFLAALTRTGDESANLVLRALDGVEASRDGAALGVEMLARLDVRQPGVAATLILADDNPLARPETSAHLLAAVDERWPLLAVRLRRRLAARHIAELVRLRAEAMPATVLEHFLGIIEEATHGT